MNNDEERALARRIQGGLHGAGLPWKDTKWETKLTEAKGYATTGYVQQSPVISDQKSSGSLLSQGDPRLNAEPVQLSDSERMIQYLDRLQGGFQLLGEKARAKLGQFCEPIGVGAEGDKNVDTRVCSSEYFRILESRVEGLRWSLEYLDGLIDSVSARSDTGPLQ